jgi:NitT/TauT family transport system ATP-binding protein
VLLQEELARIVAEMRCTVLFVTHSIDEAIYLADRVIVIAPGRITADVMTQLPRPRDEDTKATPLFNELRLRLRNALRSGHGTANDVKPS